jgi:hypothetical protein
MAMPMGTVASDMDYGSEGAHVISLHRQLAMQEIVSSVSSGQSER